MRAEQPEHALIWLEEAPESEARLTLMRWSARGNTATCAQTLALASRRLRRLLVESVRAATWDELAPAIGSEPAMIRALARRLPTVFDQMPLVALVRATLVEPSDAWIVMVRDRLITLPSPDHELADLLHDFRDLVARRVGEIDALLTELRGRREPDTDHELELLDDQRVALESALEAAARLVVH